MSNECCQRFYRVLPDDARYPDQWFLDDPTTTDGQEIDPREFSAGCPYTGALPAHVSIGKPGTELAFSFGGFDMPVVSREVVRIVSEVAGDDVECFPVTIEGAIGQYAILNARTSLDCLDEEHSEFTRWTAEDHRSDLAGKYYTISTIRLDPRRIGNHQVFCIKDWPVALFASERIRLALRGIADLGIIYKPVS